MKSAWMCRPLYGGGLAWAVYRLIDAAGRDEPHNREYHTGYVLGKADAGAQAAKLNNEEGLIYDADGGHELGA